jgi:hypothetical protein
MNNKTSKEVLEMIMNDRAETYDYVLARIRETTDVYKLRAMLLDTLENAKNAEELANDILEFYIED